MQLPCLPGVNSREETDGHPFDLYTQLITPRYKAGTIIFPVFLSIILGGYFRNQ